MKYNYAIIGAGVAGLKLALELHNNPFFALKKILILEKSTLETNDKRWCYWEKGEGKLDTIVHHTWNIGKFIKKDNSLIEFKLNEYQYKMVLGLDFYNYAKDVLSKNPNIHWVTDEVMNTQESNSTIEINCKNTNYTAEFSFDSRITPKYFKKNKYLNILQHFKGFVIKFQENIWNPNEFTMMDFTASHENQTSFMYVLPVKPNEALVEFTLFTPQILEDKTYDKFLYEYIKEKISDKEFEILEIEKGVIPMTNFPFHKTHTVKTLKIGTAGGWVRPSTGYSFKKSDFYVEQIIENIITNKKIDFNLFKPRSYFIDTFLLSILKNENEIGPEIFAEMYQKIDKKLMFEFLDGTTTLKKDLKVMASFKPFPFIKAFFREFVFKKL